MNADHGQIVGKKLGDKKPSIGGTKMGVQQAKGIREKKGVLDKKIKPHNSKGRKTPLFTTKKP